MDGASTGVYNFQVRHPRCVDRIISIGKMQSNTTFNICITKRFFYIACLHNYMFRPLYRPSSGFTISYYKANYTVYNAFVFVNEVTAHIYKIFTQNNYISSRSKKLF